jgi:hypothetical protein
LVTLSHPKKFKFALILMRDTERSIAVTLLAMVFFTKKRA